jgi:hypothetical protein
MKSNADRITRLGGLLTSPDAGESANAGLPAEADLRESCRPPEDRRRVD